MTGEDYGCRRIVAKKMWHKHITLFICKPYK
jgi:hypothetical protein